MFDVIVATSQEVQSSIVYATMIIVLVFLPLFALSGIEGRLFSPASDMPTSLRSLSSLVVSITLTPVITYYLPCRERRRARHRKALWQDFSAERRCRRTLAWTLQRIGGALVSAAAMVILAIVAGILLPRAFLPPFNEGTLTINTLFNPGISLVGIKSE